jgi:glycosyltransferase involved in cell wall biosynthesis
MFVRNVDAISGAFLMTRRDLYEKNQFEGARDSQGKSAGQADQSWYEKVDYCIRLWNSAKRIVYDPDVNTLRLAPEVLGSTTARQQTAAGRRSLIDRHQEWLATRFGRSRKHILSARQYGEKGKRILFFDDRVPDPTFGSGDPRSNRILSEMVRLGYFITYYPLADCKKGWLEVYKHVDRRVEVMVHHDYGTPREFLKARAGYYDILFVSRPHNMEYLKNSLWSNGIIPVGARIVYDAEALYCLRTMEQLQLSGKAPSPEELRQSIDRELKIAEGCTSVVTVSDSEGRHFMSHGFTKVYTLGHAVDPSPTPNPFELRSNLLFVGGIHLEDSPNADAVGWFIKGIFPYIREKFRQEIVFLVVGTNNSIGVNGLASECVRFTGRVDDIKPYYDQARIFVAPTRFAAGIPLKVYEAAAHGLPVVTTPLLSEQLGWQDNVELLVADTAASFASQCIRLYQDCELWNRLRTNALDRVKKDCSLEGFSVTLKRALEETLRQAQ